MNANQDIRDLFDWATLMMELRVLHMHVEVVSSGTASAHVLVGGVPSTACCVYHAVDKALHFIHNPKVEA